LTFALFVLRSFCFVGRLGKVGGSGHISFSNFCCWGPMNSCSLGGPYLLAPGTGTEALARNDGSQVFCKGRKAVFLSAEGGARGGRLANGHHLPTLGRCGPRRGLSCTLMARLGARHLKIVFPFRVARGSKLMVKLLCPRGPETTPFMNGR